MDNPDSLLTVAEPGRASSSVLREEGWKGEPSRAPSGIRPLDDRLEGLERGGTYLWAGTPGPAKMVALLQFLHAGLAAGERCLFLTGSKTGAVMDVARAWGFPLEDAWRDRLLELVGFRDDFEMRVLRSTEPEDAMAELSRLAPSTFRRIAVDPGSLLLGGGARSLVGRAFLEWARNHPATVWATLSVENGGAVPASADWLVQETSGVFLMDRRSDGLFQVRMNRSVPTPNGGDGAITLQLEPGRGLVAPDRVPSRRRSDRPMGDPNRILLVEMAGGGRSEIRAWTETAFRTEGVEQALEAVARLQRGGSFGGVLVHISRSQVREAVQACRAIRPLTAAAIVVASDDPVRSADRVELLEAGADDCLSGGVDFGELATRLRQAISTGGKMAAAQADPAEEPGTLLAGEVPLDVLGEEAARRAVDPRYAVFALVQVRSSRVSQAELAEALQDSIRGDQGDLVACGGQTCLVLLQGARREPAQAFLARLTGLLAGSAGGDPGLEHEVLVHPVDADRIRPLLAPRGGKEEKVSEATPGGTRASTA